MQLVTGLAVGAKVLLDGVRHEAHRKSGGNLIFLDPKSGDERSLSYEMQRQLALEFRLIDAELPKDYEETIAKARAASFNVFSFENRIVAQRRLKYVQAVLALPPKFRNRKAEISKCIDAVFAELIHGDRPVASEVENDDDPENLEQYDNGDEPDAGELMARRDMLAQLGRDLDEGKHVPPDARPPTPRSVRRWYGLYVASGRDARVLLNLDCLKGNRTARYADETKFGNFKWVDDLVEATIDEAIAQPTPASFTQAWELACGRIRANAMGRELPKFAEDCGGISVIGKNLLRRRVAKRDRFELAVSQVGVFEARRRFDSVMLGPQGERPNHEWEVDHTRLDIMVVDVETRRIYGRPWLTSIIDRYSRCIVGYSLSFAPPSWVSVMNALRIALEPKAARLAAVTQDSGVRFDNTWDCQGIPDVLITDHGLEFKSNSMDSAMAILGTRLLQTKRRRPWLKGKIERWFGTLEGFIHSVPGTTFADFYKREHYKSEKFAILDVKQTNALVAKWIVDVYHQKEHSKLDCAPAEKWRLGVTQIRLPRLLPVDQLKPSLGLVVRRTLRRGGVTFEGLRWDSRGFARLRRRPAGQGEIQIRIDPTDLSTAYAWDEDRKRWVEGALQEPSEVIEHEFTLDQWHYVEHNRKELMRDGRIGRQVAIERSIVAIKDHIEDIRDGYEKSPAYRRYLEFTTQGKDAWALTSPQWTDEEGRVRGHDLDEVVEDGPPRHEFSPYRDSPSLSPEADSDPDMTSAPVEDAPEPPPEPPKPERKPRPKRTAKPKSEAESGQLDLGLSEPLRSEASPETQPSADPPEDEFVDDFVDDEFEGSCEIHSKSTVKGPTDDEDL